MRKFFTLCKLIEYANNNGIPKILPKYFLGYLIAGISAVLTLLTIQIVLINVFNIVFFITQIVGTICGIFVSFSINNIFTFRKNNKTKLSKKLIQFLITNLISMVLNVLIASYMFKLIKIWYLASITGILFAVFFNYLIYRNKIWN